SRVLGPAPVITRGAGDEPDPLKVAKRRVYRLLTLTVSQWMTRPGSRTPLPVCWGMRRQRPPFFKCRCEKDNVRVLVVEDERVLADTVAVGLRRESMAVDVVYDGDTALEHLAVNDYDDVVLDQDLPGNHGDDVARSLATDGYTGRILMLTASDAVEDKLEDRSIGAADYTATPFAIGELIARVHALARRPTPPLPPVLERLGIPLDPANHKVYRDGEELSLTPKEFAVLQVLMRAQGTVVSAE